MKKIFLLTLLFVLLAGSRIYAAGNYIRVGLSNKAYSVGSTSGGFLFGYEKNSEFISSGNITSSNSLSVSVLSKYFLSTSESFDTYEAAKQFAGSISQSGYTTAPALIDVNAWRVYIGGFDSESEANQAKMNIGLTVSTVQRTNRVVISADGKTAVIFDNPNMYGQIKAADGTPLTAGDRKYRGRIEFNLLTGAMTAVNVLTIDEYLYSAVPSEMPSSWNIEALRAQAVAMRTYTKTRMSAHLSSGYELCDASHCQVYKGSSAEAETTTKAVDDTSGIMIYYNNEIINAVFHSSSGGYTEDSENVWTNKVDYLRSVKELNETTGKVWSRTFTLSEITDLLNRNNINIGSARDVRIGGKSAAGRVTELVIEGTSGTKSLTKEEIRTFFSPSTGGLLESRNFTIGDAGTDMLVYISGNLSTVHNDLTSMKAINGAKSISSLTERVTAAGFNTTAVYNKQQASSYASSPNEILFSGRGWGHGVGMSQHGADGMAKLGYKYDEILKYYYTNVEVRRD